LVSSAHASAATATASLYFLSALYCSALPPRCIFLQICLWPRRQWSCWQVASQYLVLHLAAGRFDEFAFREASAPRAPRPEAVPESVGAMRSLIASAGLSSADCVEKSELRARSVLALERLAEAKRLRDARNE
jgi:hypothetical protein